jgi:hypothetical protein
MDAVCVGLVGGLFGVVVIMKGSTFVHLYFSSIIFRYMLNIVQTARRPLVDVKPLLHQITSVADTVQTTVAKDVQK